MKIRHLAKFVAILSIFLSLIGLASAQTVGPVFSSVPGQTIDCTQQFTPIDLSQYVTDPDSTVLSYSYHDSLDFNVQVSGSIVTITHNGGPRMESIGFTVIDESGHSDTTRAYFSVTCDVPTTNPVVTGVYTASVPVPPPYNPVSAHPHVPYFGGFGGYGLSFFPDTYATHAPETCAISTGHGLVQDFDCDGVPEPVDNCPGIFNPDQADQNFNGLGDACDIVIADFSLQPNELSCGRAMVVNAQIVNNADIPFGPVKVTLKGENLETSNYITVLQPGLASEVELTSRIPLDTKPGAYTFTLEVEYNVGSVTSGTAVSQEVTIDANACKTKPEDHFVDVQEIQDIRPGEKAIFPIKITNTEERSNSYILDVKDVSDFGSYAIEPGSLVIIGAGETQTVYLNVWANDDVREGSQTFVVEVRQGSEVEQIVLVANILPTEVEENRALAGTILLGVLLVAGFALLLFALLNAKLPLGTRGEKRSRKTLPMTGDKHKIALTGVVKERGWLYFVDKEGDVARSKMAWMKE